MSVIVAATLTTTAFTAPANPHVSYQMLKRGSAKYHVITANVPTGEVTAAAVAHRGLTSIWNLIHKEQPIAAITGTFFHTKNGAPVGDILIDGSLFAKGQRGSAIGVSHYGEVKIFDTPFRQAIDWGEYRSGMRGAVRVVSNGTVHPNPKAQRFRDPRIWGRAARTGVGTTKSGKLVLIATASPVTLSQLGNAMVKVGVKNGIALDGGGSTALYFRGSMVISPKRKLSNLLVVKSSGFGRDAMGGWSASR
jgi:exopolysaccharide biosynthesis protein